MAFICLRKAIRISKTVGGCTGGSIGSKSTFWGVARISSVHNINPCTVRRWWKGYITTKFFPIYAPRISGMTFDVQSNRAGYYCSTAAAAVWALVYMGR